MILFIFEGEDREPHVYATIERLFFARKNDNIICSFGNNIYELYKELTEYDGDGDVVAIMKERLTQRGDKTLELIRSTDIAEIFLFFDYDFQNTNLTPEEMNRQIEEMLQMFDNETDAGKLYVNYPMVESIRYTKELPDADYPYYEISRDDCHDFKRRAHEFSHYVGFDHILFKEGETPSKEKYQNIEENWRHLKIMNVSKANLIVNGRHSIPEDKSDIDQLSIFRSQKLQFVEPRDCVSILNSFPIFLYDYLK